MSEFPQQSLAALIAAQAAVNGDAVAVDDGETRLSYAELITRARMLAAALVPLTEPVGILLPVGTGYIVAIVAALLAGKTFVPMDESFPEKRNLRIVAHSGMTAVIVDDRTAGRIEALDRSVKRIAIDTVGGGIPPDVPARPDRILTIFYTSGSTGEPKGVCHSEAGLLYDLRHFIESHGLRAGDVHSLLFSPSVSISNRDLFATLIVGARLAIVDLKRIGVGPALAALEAQGVSVFHSVPSAFRALFGTSHPAAPAAARAIRMVRLNGDRVLKRDVELYRSVFAPDRRLSLDIATTETRPYAAWMIDHDTALPRPLVPVGYPRPDLNVALLDDDGAAVPDGEIGEIVVASEGLSAGYWRDPELTAQRFAASARLPGMTEYRTGDFGRLLPDGLLEFVGRRDRQIKVRGNTVHLGEIEAALGDCPGIGELAAIARTGGGETRIILYCTARAGMDDAIRAWCRAELPPIRRPAEIVVVEALPMLAPGKIDLVALERIDAERAREAPAREPAGADDIARAWAARLGAEALASDATFEEAGGDSLQAMLLILELERRLGRSLPNGLIDWRTRPSELSARIAALGEPERAASDRPTIFFFPGAFGADFVSADFVRMLAPAFGAVLLDYRTPRAELIGPIDREQVFREIDARIAAEGAPARLWMIGYSMGARIAAEAARRLIERGVPVEFVGLIDGPSDSLIAERVAGGGAAAPPRPPLARRIATAGSPFGFVTARAVSSLAHRMVTKGEFARLRSFAATLSRWRLKAAANEVVRVVLSRTRVKAFKDILGGPLPLPITLFVSSASYSRARFTPDLGWTPWCRGLDIIELDGDHQEILEGARAGRIVEALRNAEARLRAKRAA